MSSANTHWTNSPNNLCSSSTHHTSQPAEDILRPVRGTSSNSPACAVCKYRRRRCAPDCQLAPYFPAEKQNDFLNAHKLYGVSNMVRLLDSIKNPSEKKTAMRTMILQANIRANDPTLGCCRIIQNLQHQIILYKNELAHTLHSLEVYRSQNLHEMQNYTCYNNQDQFEGNGKGIIDADSSNGWDYYMDDIELMHSSLKTHDYMQHLDDVVEHINVENGDDA